MGKGALMGGKYASSHTAVIEAAKAPAEAAAGLTCVSKVILGMIKVIPRGPFSIKFTEESESCLLVKIRGTISIQEIRVYTTDLEQVKAVMRAAMNR